MLARTVAATRSIGSGLAGSLSGTCFEHSTSPHIGARAATGASIFGCATRQAGDPNLNTYTKFDGAKYQVSVYVQTPKGNGGQCRARTCDLLLVRQAL